MRLFVVCTVLLGSALAMVQPTESSEDEHRPRFYIGEDVGEIIALEAAPRKKAEEDLDKLIEDLQKVNHPSTRVFQPEVQVSAELTVEAPNPER